MIHSVIVLQKDTMLAAGGGLLLKLFKLYGYSLILRFGMGRAKD